MKLREFKKICLSPELWPMRKELANGGLREVSVLGIGVEPFTAPASENASPGEVLSLVKGMKECAFSILAGAPALILHSTGPVMQFLFPREKPDADGQRPAVLAALRIAREWKSLELPGEYLRPRLAVTSGTVLAGLIERGRTVELFASGSAVGLNRRLAAENVRLGHGVLLDEGSSGAVPGPRPLDLYRTPGFEEPKILYGMAGERNGALPREFSGIYLQALRELYFRKDPLKARGLFDKCLELVPDDAPARFMLAKCSPSPHIRSYR